MSLCQKFIDKDKKTDERRTESSSGKDCKKRNIYKGNIENENYLSFQNAQYVRLIVYVVKNTKGRHRDYCK